MRKLFSTAFSTYCQHFWLIASVTLVVWLPYELVDSYLNYHVLEEDNFFLFLGPSLFFAVCIGAIANAGIIHSLDLTAAGIKPKFGSAIRAGFRYWPRMWLASVLMSFAAIFGLILLIVPGVIVMVRGLVVEQIVVREKLSGIAAIRRSFALTKGRFWLLAGRLLVVLIAVILVFVTSVYITEPVVNGWMSDAIVSALSSIAGTFFVVFAWVVLNFLQENELQVASEEAKPN